MENYIAGGKESGTDLRSAHEASENVGALCRRQVCGTVGVV